MHVYIQGRIQGGAAINLNFVMHATRHATQTDFHKGHAHAHVRVIVLAYSGGFYTLHILHPVYSMVLFAILTLTVEHLKCASN